MQALRRWTRRHPWLSALLILFCNTPALHAQPRTPIVVDDIVGVPSSVSLHSAQRRIVRARQKQIAQVSRRRQERQRRREIVAERLRNTPSAVVRVARANPASPRPRSGGKKGAVQPSRPLPSPVPVVEETPYQNVVLRFVNPRQEPVAGLRVTARVTGRTGEAQTGVVERVTDAEGGIRLERIGPLPVAVELEVGGEDAAAEAGAVAAAEPEWRVADVEAASILIPHTLGVKVAERTEPAAYRVASLLPAATTSPRIIRRTVIYEYRQPEPIVVERIVVDLEVAAPAGSRITTPALPGREWTVGENGRQGIRLPAALLGEGPVPLRVAREMGAGEAEAVVADYPTDAYAPNAAQSPPLRLVRLTRMQVAGNLGVMSPREDVVAALGDLSRERKNSPKGNITKLPDGSEWWEYREPGLCFQLRPTPLGKTLVERVRIASARGGAVGGIAPGSDAHALEGALGAPESDTDAGRYRTDNAAPGERTRVRTYLDRGLRVCVEEGTVRWLELARSPQLLAGGTTAFVPRTPARLYVDAFEGHARTNLSGGNDLRRYLSPLPSIRLVNDREQADLVLDARVTDFKERKDQFLIEAVPFRYACDVRIRYDLLDTATNEAVVRDKEVSAGAGADYSGEAIVAAILATASAAKGGKVGQILGGLVAVATVAELQRSVSRAVNRCPAIASRTVFNHMVADINRAADFAVRVTDVDYERGQVRVNVGAGSGIHVSTPERPCEFELLVDGVPLPSEESGLSADYYTAVVVQADATSALCELRHVKRRVDRAREKFEEKPDLAMVRRLPDPATGLVSGRASVRFPSLPIAPEESPLAPEGAG